MQVAAIELIRPVEGVTLRAHVPADGVGLEGGREGTRKGGRDSDDDPLTNKTKEVRRHPGSHPS